MAQKVRATALFLAREQAVGSALLFQKKLKLTRSRSSNRIDILRTSAILGREAAENGIESTAAFMARRSFQGDMGPSGLSSRNHVGIGEDNRRKYQAWQGTNEGCRLEALSFRTMENSSAM